MARTSEPYRAPPREKVDFPLRMLMMFKTHWRGIIGTLSFVYFCPIILDPKPKHYTLYTYLIMLVFWVIRPIPVAATALLPIFMFPFCCVEESKNVCSAYMTETIVCFITGSMLLNALVHCGVAKKIILNLMRLTCRCIHGSLFGIILTGTLSSIFIDRMFVTNTMVPLVESMLSLYSVGGSFVAFEKKGDIQVASKVSNVLLLAVLTSTTLGSLVFYIGSFTSVLLVAQYDFVYEKQPDFFSFLKYTEFAIIFVLIATVLHSLTLFIVLKIKNVKCTPASNKAVKDMLTQECTKTAPFSFQQFMSIIIVVMTFLTLLTRSGFVGSWGLLDAKTYAAGEPRYARDSAILMTAVIALHSIPANIKFLNYFIRTKKKDMPEPKQVTTLMTWHFANTCVNWPYILVFGASLNLLFLFDKTMLYRDVQGVLLGITHSLPKEAFTFIICVILTIFANFFDGATVSGILMPLFVNVANNYPISTVIFPVLIGFSCALSFTHPIPNYPTFLIFHKGSGKVKIKNNAIIGCIIAAESAILLWLLVLYYGTVMWNYDDASTAWNIRGPKQAAGESTTAAGGAEPPPE